MESSIIRKGAWSLDEDYKLINYVNTHGRGRWNLLAQSAGLSRSGRSCRLRWVNYLCPDVRRGNLTLEEQYTILTLYSSWGNRWSKIAQNLPGRTDNEIKNYWRTRIHKYAKQLNFQPNTQEFRNAIRLLLLPKLLEKIKAPKSTTITNTLYHEPATKTPTFTTLLPSIFSHEFSNDETFFDISKYFENFTCVSENSWSSNRGFVPQATCMDTSFYNCSGFDPELDFGQTHDDQYMKI